MGSEYDRLLHIFFFPFMAPGHMIPTVHMAKLFASRGVRATIVSTPLNTPLISKSLGKSKTNTHPNCIHIKTINFPCAESGLPGGCENLDSLSSPDMMEIFLQATTRLQEPFEKLLEEHRPDCIVADMFFPWANDSASKFGIPRLVFHGTSFFSLCASLFVRLFEPYKNVSSDTESFVIPNFPGEIKMTRLQVPDFIKNKEETVLTRIVKEARESELKCYGVLVNSFYELEQVYVDHYRNVLKRRSWHIGPLSLCNRDAEEKAQRGKEASIDEHECLKWLDSKEPNSVVYVCFGSIAIFPETQLRQIARGLEASGKHFIWVVRRGKKDEDKDDVEWLPEGFEESIEGKGLIIRGWAPQVLILDHETVGAFVTHCGWNSTLEGISAGVPMVTWPLSAEQFYNEKLVTDVLKIGVPVGVKKWVGLVGDSIDWDGVVRAVNRIMEGGEAEEMRKKAKELAQMARQAVEEGGSSYADLNALIEELGSRCH